MAKYQNNLREKLPVNNSGNDVVLNSYFDRWSEHIAWSLMPANRGTEYKHYEDELNHQLLNVCKKHAAKHAQPKKSSNTIMLTHPFYLPLTHANEIKKNSVKKEVDAYLDNLLELMKLNKEKQKADVVVLETLHHYAAATSLLLESGMVNRIIFTQYDSGRPLKFQDLSAYAKDSIFFGGGYISKCLSSSISDMSNELYRSGHGCSSHLWAIQELSLFSPQDEKKSLMIEKKGGCIGSSARVIGLEEALRKMDLKDSKPHTFLFWSY